MKKCFAFIVMIILAFTNCLCSADEINDKDNVNSCFTVYINGYRDDLTVAARRINNTVIIPLAEVAEDIGYKVQCNETNSIITAQKGYTDIKIDIKNNCYEVNGNKRTINIPTVTINDVVMISYGSFGDIFDCRAVLTGSENNLLRIDELNLHKIEGVVPNSSVYIDGKQVNLHDEIYNINGGIYVPVKSFFELMNIKVDFDEKKPSGKINILAEEGQINQENYQLIDNAVIPDSDTAYVIGKAILEKSTGRKMEFTDGSINFYLRVTGGGSRWVIEQEFKDSEGKVNSYGYKCPYVSINRYTGEIIAINTDLNGYIKEKKGL